ncbi:apoptotic protease-activating factor 1-like [Branchiostoma floridae x Branchiostoma belcheri]
MDERARSSLLVNRVSIIKDLKVQHVINPLLSAKVLTLDDEEEILAETTSKKRAAKLLDILPSRGNLAFVSFYKSLQDQYTHLAELLAKDLPSSDRLEKIQNGGKRKMSTIDVETVLVEGGVPPRPRIFIKRPAQSQQIRNALQQLKDEPGWVVVHGMGGSGKSVLAGEVVRDQELLEECFPGGVFWVSLGQIDKPMLLMKMQNLCLLLDKEHQTPPRNAEEAKDRLRLLFTHQHPRALLILDDVWTARDAKMFDVRCRTMLTTRDSSVTDAVRGNISMVPIREGFSKEQSDEVLASWTETKVSDLPPEASQIYTECGGHPLAICMIGALLKDHPNRWQYYLKHLQNRKMSKFKKTLPYEYQSLAEAIAISVDHLDKDMRDLYQQFAVFDNDTLVPTQVLSILWEEEVELVEDTMDELCKKSLAFQSWDEKQKTFVYSVHDLQLDYLKEQCEDMQSLHATLVTKYEKVCKGEFHTLEDDGYIHWHMEDHLAASGRVNDLCSILSSLDWVGSKVRITGPSFLVEQYVKHGKILCQNRGQQLRDFETFLRTNLHRFFEDPFPDIVQLGLNQYSESEVYQQALSRATQNDNHYFVWSGKDTVKDPTQLTVKVHSGGVHFAKFSPDGNQVASCGEDCSIKVWDAHTGQVQLTLEGHRDVVYCCGFSPDGATIVSCAGDRLIHVWNAATGKLMHTFHAFKRVTPCGTPTRTPSFGSTRRTLTDPPLMPRSRDPSPSSMFPVFSVKYSPDGTKLVCCSGEGLVKILDSISGVELHTFTAHTDSVRCCDISSDGSLVVSASTDGTAVVWNTKSGKQITTYRGHNRSALSACSFKPESHVVASSADYQIHVWEAMTAEKLGVCKAHKSTFIQHCCFSPDGSLIAGGLSNFSIQLWDTESMDCVAMHYGHTMWVYCVAFSANGKQLLSSSEDEKVILWDVEGAKRIDYMGLKRDFDVNFDMDPFMVVAPDNNDTLRVMKGNQAEVVHQTDVSFAKSRIRACCICPSGNKVAYGCEDGVIKLLHFTPTGVKSRELVGHNEAVRCCSFSQDGRVLITGGDDSKVLIWELENKTSIECVGHRESVRHLKIFSLKRKKFLTASYDGSIKVWDIMWGMNEFSCKDENEQWVLSCDLSPDESKIASTSVDRVVRIWDAKDGALLHKFTGHVDCIRSCAFTLDSSILATGDDAGYVKVWDVEKGEEIITCDHHPGGGVWVRGLQFSSDGKQLVSAANNVKWWTVDGKLLQTFHIKGSFVKSLQASKDFKTFVTIDSSGFLYILNMIEKK